MTENKMTDAVREIAMKQLKVVDAVPFTSHTAVESVFRSIERSMVKEPEGVNTISSIVPRIVEYNESKYITFDSVVKVNAVGRDIRISTSLLQGLKFIVPTEAATPTKDVFGNKYGKEPNNLKKFTEQLVKDNKAPLTDVVGVSLYELFANYAESTGVEAAKYANKLMPYSKLGTMKVKGVIQRAETDDDTRFELIDAGLYDETDFIPMYKNSAFAGFKDVYVQGQRMSYQDVADAKIGGLHSNLPSSFELTGKNADDKPSILKFHERNILHNLVVMLDLKAVKKAFDEYIIGDEVFVIIE